MVQAGYSKGGGSAVNVHVSLVQDPQAGFHTSEFIGQYSSIPGIHVQNSSWGEATSRMRMLCRGVESVLPLGWKF